MNQLMHDGFMSTKAKLGHISLVKIMKLYLDEKSVVMSFALHDAR